MEFKMWLTAEQVMPNKRQGFFVGQRACFPHQPDQQISVLLYWPGYSSIISDTIKIAIQNPGCFFQHLFRVNTFSQCTLLGRTLKKSYIGQSFYSLYKMWHHILLSSPGRSNLHLGQYHPFCRYGNRQPTRRLSRSRPDRCRMGGNDLSGREGEIISGI